ncbi:DNA replication and repair protein RecF [Candidatus Saccharibacteria bacterium TM7i]|nr:DNA replication and repair protein RecF [Candidatus Saccharibacteria bacterium TM7i]
MVIKSLSVLNVRSHENKKVTLSSGVTVITGKNGIGKTTLLEAVYVALQGTSFKGVDADILQQNAPWYRIDLGLDDDASRSVTFDPSRASGKKRFIVDDKTSYRLSPRSKYPIVLFEPEDLRLLHGSPARRRLFIDRFITQIDPTYGMTLRKYERALKQRNTLLKKEFISNEDLFAWNISLSEYGAKIIEQRVQAVELINKELNNYYHEIAHTDDEVTVHYSHTIIDHSAQKLLRELEGKFAYDRVVKHTSVGPHRHDIVFNFNNSPALSVASRGEVRTILLALKRIEESMIAQSTGKRPLILLDDVFSELDKDRQDYIIDYFKDNQVIISSATKLTYDGFLHIEL